MDVKKILEEIKAGRITVEEAEERLKDLPYEDLEMCIRDRARSRSTS